MKKFNIKKTIIVLKSVFLHTLFTLFTFQVFESCKETSLNKNINYLDYHSAIISIEQNILDNNETIALNRYDSLFKIYKPFAKDAMVALQLACRQNDPTITKRIFNISFLSGISIEFCKLVPIINNKLNAGLQFDLQNLYDSCRPKYLATLNQSLRKVFFQNSKKDNIASVGLGKYQNIADSMVLKNAEKEYVKITEDNLKYLIEISKKLGYVPFDRTIGIVDNTIELDPQYKTTINSMSLYSITIQTLMHHGYGFFQLKKELLKSVEIGELHPRLYGLIYDFSHEYYTGFGKNSTMCSNLAEKTDLIVKLEKKFCQFRIASILFCFSPDMKDSYIDSCRKDLRICSKYHDQRIKAFEKNSNIKMRFGAVRY